MVLLFAKLKGRDDELMIECVDLVDACYRLIILKDLGYVPLAMYAGEVTVGFNENSDKAYFVNLLDTVPVGYERNKLHTILQSFSHYAKTFSRVDNPRLSLSELEIEKSLRKIEKIYDPVSAKNIRV